MRGQSPLLRLTPLSVQLAKFSEDTLSSYTEAVSTQVHSRRVGSSLASSRSPGRSSFVTPSHTGPVSLPCPENHLPTPTAQCPRTLFSVGLRGSLQGNTAGPQMASWTFSSPTRKCYAAFGATSCG